MTGPRVAAAVLVLFAMAGMGVAGYLTSVHYASVPLACGGSGVIDCNAILTSSYSEVLGVPWSVGGIAWFTVSGILAGIGLARSREPEWLQPAQVAWTVLGLAVVLYLVQVEVVRVGHICIWCTSMHVLIVLSLVIAVLRPVAIHDGAEVSV